VNAGSAEALLDLRVNGPVPLLQPPHDYLQPVLDQLTAKDREQLYLTAREFAQEFLDDLARLGV